MIDQSTIERIMDAARIQEVVSDYVTLRRRGANLTGLCPFHNEKTPSFSVSPAKGIFKCFGCGKGGNSVHFIMEHEQVSYYEALKFLAAKYHIEVVEKELDAEELALRNDRESMFLVNDFARQYFMNTLHGHIDGKAIGLSYFRERGFREDIIRKFELGFSLEQRDGFSQAALQKGFKKEYMVKTGLSMENDFGQLTDRFRGRVMFPVHSLSGKVVAFGGRILKKDDKMAKYVNSPESEIYHKSNELYGIFFARKAIVQQDRCFLVEGYTDVISMFQNGIENVVASSGTALTPQQIRLIHRFTDNVTVIYDGDPAGIKASLRGIDLLLEEGMNIRVLLLPDGDDPDSFARKTTAAGFIEFVEQHSVDFIRFKTNLLMEDAGNDPVKRAALIGDIVRSIALIPNQMIRTEYVKQCSTLLQVEEALLYFEINKLKTNGTQAPTGTPEKSYTDPTKFEAEERNLLQMLIRYGRGDMQDPIVKKQHPEPLMVADYILDEINRDGLEMNNPLHRQILKEYEMHWQDEQFNAEKYFLYHRDENIARLGVELMTEKYTLSKIHSKMKKVDTDAERLHDMVPRLVYEYKNALILDYIREALMRLKQASEAHDDVLASQLMQELKQLDELKRQLALSLGARIITRF
ncbi:MAG: DNA primase [Paludibacter sp.]|nr:DNA primase [Paludibacter sp.]